MAEPINYTYPELGVVSDGEKTDVETEWRWLGSYIDAVMTHDDTAWEDSGSEAAAKLRRGGWLSPTTHIALTAEVRRLRALVANTQPTHAGGAICYVVAFETRDSDGNPVLQFWPDSYMERADAEAEINYRGDDGDDQLWNRRVLRVVA